MHAKPVARALLLSLVSFVVASAQDALPAQSVGQLLRRVDDHYNRLLSMQTRYTERYSGIGMSRSESGTLLLKKPGRMLWRYDQPAGKVFVFDGKFAWFYMPGDAQVQRVPASRLDDLRTPLRFLLGHTALERELTGVRVTQDGALLHIVGAPRGTQNIREIALKVTPLGEIVGLSATELDGSMTSFEFAGIEENVPTKDGDFRFTPPPGVPVVTGAAPCRSRACQKVHIIRPAEPIR